MTEWWHCILVISLFLLYLLNWSPTMSIMWPLIPLAVCRCQRHSSTTALSDTQTTQNTQLHGHRRRRRVNSDSLNKKRSLSFLAVLMHIQRTCIRRIFHLKIHLWYHCTYWIIVAVTQVLPPHRHMNILVLLPFISIIKWSLSVVIDLYS